MQDNCGTSLVEVFSVEQITSHIERLRMADPASEQPAAPGRNGALSLYAQQQQQNGFLAPNCDDENACSMCGIIRLTFEPAALYCTSCAQRIKRNHVRTSACPLLVKSAGHFRQQTHVRASSWDVQGTS